MRKFAPQSIEAGKSTPLKTVSALGLTRDGYSFNHWNTSADDSGDTTYKDGASVTLNADLTLFAVWTQEATTYTIDGTTYTVAGDTVTTETASGSAEVGSVSNGIIKITYGNLTITIGSDGSITVVVGDNDKTYTGTIGDDGSATLTNTANADDTMSVTSETSEVTAAAESSAETLSYYVGSSRDYATVGAAVDAINALGKSINSYIIYIDGTVAGKAEISSLTATALTIKGANSTSNTPTDILTLASGETDSVLTISTAVPVTLENIKITGGTGKPDSTTPANTTGGGLYIGSNANVTLSSNAVITENTSTNGGGGVRNLGTLSIAGGTISYNTIGDTETKKGNGGGIRNDGTVTMTSGYITHNTASRSGGDGGGIKGGAFTMYGGEISYNKTYTNGGGVSVTNFTMEGGTISYNEAQTTTSSYGSGGGVRVDIVD